MIHKLNARLAGFKERTEASVTINLTTFQILTLTTITLLAAVIRFYKLGQWSFWIDEVLEIGYAREALRNFPSIDRASLLLIGSALSSLGVSEWNARLVPNLVGIISIPILFVPIKKLFGTFVGLFSVFLIAISPWHLYWSQNARFYVFLMLFYALGQLAFFFWLESDRFWYLVLAGLMFGLAVLERMMAAFIVPVVVVYFAALLVLPFGRPAGFRWRNLVILAVPPLLFGLYTTFATSFFPEFSFYILGHEHDPVRVFLSIVYDIGLPLFLVALMGGMYLLLQKSRAGLYLLLGAVIPTVLLVAVAPFTQAFSRYVFITLPNFAILGAVAAREVFVQTQKHARVLAVGILLLLVADAASQDVLYFGYQNGNRVDWKGAFAQVQQRRAPGEWVITTRPEIGAYYLGEQVIDSQQLNLRAFRRGKNKAWFVIDNRTYVSPDMQYWLENSTQIIGVYDVIIPGKTMTLRVYYYDPDNKLPAAGAIN